MSGGLSGALRRFLPLAAPSRRALSVKGKEARNKYKNMNTQENNNNLAAPSVTIAPRNPSKGVLLYVVTLTTFKTVQSYPCRSMQKASELANRFVAGIIKSAQ